MWRFIILTYPFNVVHNVKFLRFRLFIFHLGRHGGSQKFVSLQEGYIVRILIRLLVTTIFTSYFPFHRCSFALLYLLFIFIFTIFIPVIFLRMYVHLHLDIFIFSRAFVLFSTSDSLHKLIFVHTRGLVSLRRGTSCICRKYSNRYRGQGSVLTVHVVDTYRWVEVGLHVFLALTIGGSEWSSSPPSFIPGNVKFIIYFKWACIFQITVLPSA